MQKILCKYCDKSAAIGYLRSNPSLAICRNCRDMVLTGLNHYGVVLSTTNPFVDELCSNSHAVKSGSYQYYDSLLRDQIKIESERKS